MVVVVDRRRLCVLAVLALAVLAAPVSCASSSVENSKILARGVDGILGRAQDENASSSLASWRGTGRGRRRTLEISDGRRPLPSEWDGSLKPPEYCYTSPTGKAVKPAPAPKKSPIPTNYARQVLQLASKDRPCIILSRGCANESSTRHASARRLPYFHRYFDKTSKLTEEEKIMKFPTLFPGEWGSCAIVGNGDNMIKGQYGKEIDDHDFVARYNVITKPYAKAVGTKVSGMFDKFNYRIGPHKPDRMPTMVSHKPRHASLFSFSSLLPLSLRRGRDRVTPPPPSPE